MGRGAYPGGASAAPSGGVPHICRIAAVAVGNDPSAIPMSPSFRAVCTLLVAMTPAALWADDAPTPGLAARYVTEIIADVSGGRQRGAGWLGRFDVSADTGSDVLGVAGASAHLDLILIHGPSFSDRYAGDAQTLSNIDASSALRPFEAWVQLPLAPHVRTKIGLIDLNDEFDQQSFGDPFLNSSFGIGPDLSQSGLNGPSNYPVTAPAVMIAAEQDGRSFRIGMFDAEPGFPDHPHRFLPGPPGRDGALLIAEAGMSITDAVRMQVGGWRYTNRFARLDAHGRSSDGGVYALIEGRLAGQEKGQALKAWLRTGWAADKAEPIGFYLGGGMSYGDDDRLFGIAFAHAALGSPARRAGLGEHHAETSFEAMVYRRVTSFLIVQPDVQYVVHPSWQAGLRNALVLALRCRFAIGPG